MKYKISDKVIIKEDEGYCLEVQMILSRINHISIIRKVVKGKYGHNYYRLKELDEWRWEDRHLEGLVLESVTRFEIMEL